MADPYIGQIVLLSIGYVPSGYMLCDGGMLSISENMPLYSVIGTTYGGDGVTSFALPDLRGRALIGGNSDGTSHSIGRRGGHVSFTLTASNVPTHTHALRVSSKPGTQATLAGNPIPAALASTTASLYGPVSSSTQTSMIATSLLPYGNGVPVNNMQPYLALCFCICAQGVYPPRPN